MITVFSPHVGIPAALPARAVSVPNIPQKSRAVSEAVPDFWQPPPARPLGGPENGHPLAPCFPLLGSFGPLQPAKKPPCYVARDRVRKYLIQMVYRPRSGRFLVPESIFHPDFALQQARRERAPATPSVGIAGRRGWSERECVNTGGLRWVSRRSRSAVSRGGGRTPGEHVLPDLLPNSVARDGTRTDRG
jgi:hypothetical protein